MRRHFKCKYLPPSALSQSYYIKWLGIRCRMPEKLFYNGSATIFCPKTHLLKVHTFQIFFSDLPLSCYHQHDNV